MLIPNRIENAIIDENAVVGENPEKTANLDEWGVSVIGSGITIGKDAKVKAKKMIIIYVQNF